MVPFGRFVLVAAAMIVGVSGCEATGTGAAGGPGHTTAAPRSSGDTTDRAACEGFWKAQYAWASGQQPGTDNPQEVMQTWAASGRWRPLPAIQQTGPGTFTLTAPGTGTMLGTVSGTRPVAVPGPWVITHVTYAPPPPA